MPIVILTRSHEANRRSCLHFLPSPLEGEGPGVRGLSPTAPQLEVWCMEFPSAKLTLRARAARRAPKSAHSKQSLEKVCSQAERL